MNVQLRPGVPADARECGRICYEAFAAIAIQHNFPPDFPDADVAGQLLGMMLGSRHYYSVVAEFDGRIVGSNFLSETTNVAGVGPITVDPSVQNGAIGRALMGNVLERARQRGFASVRLVQAAYHNRSLSLYTKLGFDVREPLSNLQGKPPQVAIPGHAVRPAADDDLTECAALCTRVHGHERTAELAAAVRAGQATVVESEGRIAGYASAIGFLGHAVAESNTALIALIGAAREFAGPGFLLPTRNATVLRWCLDRGLRVVQPMTLMSTGLYNKPAGAFLPSVLY